MTFRIIHSQYNVMNFIELQKQRSVDFHQDQFSVILKKIFYLEYERYKILYGFDKQNSAKIFRF